MKQKKKAQVKKPKQFKMPARSVTLAPSGMRFEQRLARENGMDLWECADLMAALESQGALDGVAL